MNYSEKGFVGLKGWSLSVKGRCDLFHKVFQPIFMIFEHICVVGMNH